MKTLLLLLALMLAAAVQSSIAQNSIKLFDARPIDVSVDYMTRSFAAKQIDLTCPVNPQSTISGPNGGMFIVDNALTINGVRAGGASIFFSSTIADPMIYVGESMETAYIGIPEMNVSGQIKSGGTYKFDLYDWGYTFGNTDVYLNTNCWLSTDALVQESDATQICHRNMGAAGQKTLTVGANAVAAHLAHGDTAGPCSE